MTIPGPLRSFLRMAGISQKVAPEEVLPLLARNVFAQGYRSGRPTEFLILLDRYTHQARELTTLARTAETIRVENCAAAAPLLHILGYRLRQACGQPDSSLVTADPERAFITVDSGFPLQQLEESLAKNAPFTYQYPSALVPVLFSDKDWIDAGKYRNGGRDFVSTLLRDPSLARLYWGMSRSDSETLQALRQSVGLGKLVPSGPVFDFYGSRICIRSGRVLVPGGAPAESAWKDLVGASPESPAKFVVNLLSKDKGWLAAYFDALSRTNQTQQAHLTDGPRLKIFYEAFRSSAISDMDAARPVFRPAAALLLLVTRVRWEANGDPQVPGNLQVWEQILREQSTSKAERAWAKKASRWTRSGPIIGGDVCSLPK